MRPPGRADVPARPVRRQPVPGGRTPAGGRAGAGSRSSHAPRKAGITSTRSGCRRRCGSRTTAAWRSPGDRLCVVSQESSALWVGRLAPSAWRVRRRRRGVPVPARRRRQGRLLQRRGRRVAVGDRRSSWSPTRRSRHAEGALPIQGPVDPRLRGALVVHPANQLIHASRTLPVYVHLNGLAVWL